MSSTASEWPLTNLIPCSQLLAIANTATSTFSTLLSQKGTSIPAFQTFFNYVLLNLIFTSYTLYRYGIKGWARMVYKHGWKCMNLSPPPKKNHRP